MSEASRPRIAILCATRRGYLILERLLKLAPQAEVVVFSFREEPWEPPFMDDIRRLAEGAGARFVEAKQVGDAKLAELWDERPLDLLLAVSWRYMVPEGVYGKARRGAFVFHDSLLPTYRGFAPTVWAMINGEAETGATLFQMGEGVDAGPVAGQAAVAIGADETIADVMGKVTEAYLKLLDQSLPGLLDGTIRLVKQDESKATYTCKRVPEDGRIDWNWTARRVYDLIRASTKPYPGAFTFVEGKRLTVWGAARVEGRRYVGFVPGRIADIGSGGVTVLCGDGNAVCLTRVQVEGETERGADEVIRKLGLTLGS